MKLLRYLPLILIVTIFGLAAQSGNAATGSIQDCEKIQAADAYNRCLASFGPVAHEPDLKPVPAGLGTGQRFTKHHRHHRAHYRHAYRHVRGAHIGKRSHRKSMQLSVDSRRPQN